MPDSFLGVWGKSGHKIIKYPALMELTFHFRETGMKQQTSVNEVAFWKVMCFIRTK